MHWIEKAVWTILAACGLAVFVSCTAWLVISIWRDVL